MPKKVRHRLTSTRKRTRARQDAARLLNVEIQSHMVDPEGVDQQEETTRDQGGTDDDQTQSCFVAEGHHTAAETWSWGDFLLGPAEEGSPVPEEFPDEAEDCDGGRAHGFLVIIDDEAVPYDPLEVGDLDLFARQLLESHRLRKLQHLKSALRNEDLSVRGMTLLNSADHVITIAAHYAGESVGMKFVLSVNSDLFMTVQVHMENVSPQHEFWDGLPTHSFCLADIKRVLDKLLASKICPGNVDAQFQRLVPERVAFCNKEGSAVAFREPFVGAEYKSTIRSVRCPMLLDSSSTFPRCRACHVFRKTLLKRVKPRPLQENLTSSHVSHNNMTRRELCQKLQESKEEKKVLKAKLEKLNKEVFKRIETEGTKMTDADSQDLIQLLRKHRSEIVDSFAPDSLPRIFWEQQLKYYNLQNKTGMRWHPMIVRWCLYLKHKSAAAYDALQQSGFVALPSNRTLYDYSNILPSKPGFQPETVSHLRVEAGKAGMFRHKWNSYVGLLQDEIHVSQGLVYNKHTGELVGYTDLQNTAEELSYLGRCAEGKRAELATHVLVLMVRGATSSLKYPLAAFPTRGINSEFLYPIMWEAIHILEQKCDLKVLYITCDGASPNRKFFKLHKQNDEPFTYWCWNHFSYPQRKLYFVSDVPHLLKTTRNCFSNSFAHSRSRMLWKDGYDISWKHIVRLYEELVSGRVFSQAHKLTDNHVHLTAFSCMKVNLAAQVMSETVANCLEQNYGDDVKETVQFIRHMNKFFDCLNTRSIYEAGLKRNPNLQEFRDPTDPRLVYLLDEFLPYFAEWEQSVSTRQGFSKQEKNKMMLSHQTLTGLNITVNSIVEMTRFLLQEGAPYVLTHHFNQDPLEEHFAHCRHKGGANNNPSVQDVLNSSTKMRVIGSSALAPIRGNITKRKRNDEQVIDDSPMAKRVK